jgi:hypothetical protein
MIAAQTGDGVGSISAPLFQGYIITVNLLRLLRPSIATPGRQHILEQPFFIRLVDDGFRHTAADAPASRNVAGA